VSRPEENIPTEPRRRWEDNIKTNLKEVDEKTWPKFIWLRIGKGGGFL
jgi:hypothetical protein